MLLLVLAALVLAAMFLHTLKAVDQILLENPPPSQLQFSNLL